MNDDWLRELAQVSREEEAEERSRLDERWDRLSAGELSPEEEAELRALAETSEEARLAYEAFRPLGPEFQASVIQAIRTQGREEAEAAEAAKKKSERGKLISFPVRFAAWGTAAAAAAAILTISLREPAPLPDYASLTISGGASTMRGEQPESAIQTLAPGDSFTVSLAPETTGTYEKRLEAKCFLSCGRELRPIEVQSTFVPSGSGEITGSIPDVPSGNCTLWAVVCRQGKMPDADELRSLLKTTPVPQDNWVAVPVNIRIQPRGP